MLVTWPAAAWKNWAGGSPEGSLGKVEKQGAPQEAFGHHRWTRFESHTVCIYHHLMASFLWQAKLKEQGG